MGDEKEAAARQDEDEGSLVPATLAGIGILAVAALLILWPFGDDATSGADGQAAQAAGSDRASAQSRSARGGVKTRDYDEAKGRKVGPRRNPAIKLPNAGIAPGPPPSDEPPSFNSHEEELAWYERRLEQEIKMREKRKQYVERLPKIRAQIESGPNSEEGLKAFEGRKKIVEDNYDKSVKRVDDLEKKLEELRGG